MLSSPPLNSPPPLAARAESLGLVLLAIEPSGRTRSLSNCPWFERLLITSPLWTSSLFHEQHRLDREACVTLWPGVHLAPVSVAKPDGSAPQFDRLAVLLLTPELQTSEELQQVCAAARLDLRATLARLEPDRLVHPSEVNRLAITLRWLDTEASAAQTYRTELQGMGGELANTYEELSLLYKLSSSMTLDQPSHRFFTEACGELQQVLSVRWLALLLIDDEPRLQDLAGKCWHAGAARHESAAIQQLGLRLLSDLGDRTTAQIIDDVSSLGGPEIPVQQGLLSVPLRAEGKTIGVMFACDRLDGEHLTSIDAKLCASLCNTLSIFIENTMLFEDVQAMFVGSLQALTAAIDAKDTYTHGHSERVALLSQMLAEKIGLDEATCHRVYLAGLIHDVGKIGVPEAVLCKPGKLTDPEFECIKAHPRIGANILRGIRQMHDLLPGVLHHHEKWDGRGYPDKLAGEQIPLFGRIIGLADAFDAMSSNRTYRAALTDDHVLNEIRRSAGTHFDPCLAEAFVTLDFQPFRDLILRHRDLKGDRSA